MSKIHTVTWVIEVDAETPEEAAREALNDTHCAIRKDLENKQQNKLTINKLVDDYLNLTDKYSKLVDDYSNLTDKYSKLVDDYLNLTDKLKE